MSVTDETSEVKVVTDGGSDRDSSEVFSSPIRVSRSTVLPLDELVSRANSRTRNGYKFSEGELYFWSAEVSNTRVDTYFTSMAPSSLKNYAEDGEQGVAFQNSHARHLLPFGHSLAGRFITGSNARTNLDFYTIKDFNINGINTNELIRGMETGILNDVSVGFYGGWYRCSICGKDMLDWSKGWDEMCPHIPGIEYEITNKSGEEERKELAIAYIENARLSEVSVVYDGACPGAAIRKATIEAESGRMRPDVASIIESRYRVKLPGSSRTFAGVELPHLGELPFLGGERLMTMEERNADVVVTDETVVEATETADESRVVEEQNTDERVAEVVIEPVVEPIREQPATPIQTDPADALRSALTEAGIKSGQDPMATLRSLVDEVRRNRPLAKDGIAYRNDLISSALEEGVRAMGDKFDAESYKTLLADASIDTIKSIRDGFANTAATIFQPGRSTVDEDGDRDTGNITPINNRRPASVYANG